MLDAKDQTVGCGLNKGCGVLSGQSRRRKDPEETTRLAILQVAVGDAASAECPVIFEVALFVAPWVPASLTR